MSNNSTYYNRKAAGLCPFCGALPVPGKRGGTLRCEACREKHAQRSKNRYHERSKDACWRCGSPLTQERVGMTLCDECTSRYVADGREYRKEYVEQLRADVVAMYGGVCQTCGQTRRWMDFHHVDGSGDAERTSATGAQRGSLPTLFRLRRDGVDPNIQLLCRACHNALRRKVST